MSASDTPVHTCSYSCQRPECMNAQRAELLAKLAAYESVEVPEEPEHITHFIGDKNDCRKYIDTLLRAYRAQAVRLSEAERDAERLVWLFSKARQDTAYDRYGNGGHWHIGFFSDDNTLDFRAAIDAALAQGRQGGVE